MRVAIDGVEMRYGEHRAVAGVDLRLEPGRVTALVGPNGCGKSTLLRGIAGVQALDAGRVALDGVALGELGARDRARRVSLLPQSPIAPEGITVQGLVQFGRHPHQGLFRRWSQDDAAVVARAMAETGVVELADRPLTSLSGGQRQRCWVAMALAQETPLMLLDEPTSMLDIGHQCEVLELVRRLAADGRTVAVVLHDLNAAARYADHLVAMRAGAVAAEGSPAEVLTPALIRELYQVEARVITEPGDPTPIVIAHAAQS